MNEATKHYQIPAEPGRLRALGLALLVHLLLLGFLWIGVSWQSDTPVAVEAEIWNPVAREAAPPPPPPPEPAPAPEPPKPVAAIEPPKPVAEPEPVKAKLPDPDIALEKEKKRKLDKEKAEKAEEAERKKKEQLAEKKAREEEEKRKKLAEAQEKEKEKKKLAELEKQKQAEEQKRKELAAAEEKKRLAEEQQREQQRKQEEAAAEQRAKKRRDDDLRRQMQLAGDGVAGDAEKSQGPRSDGGYARKVAGLIKSHTILPQTDIPGNPAVEFLIELLPDGGLRGEPKMTRSSGIAAFDQAVRRAIEKSTPFPPDPATGKVPSSISISHRPKDSENR